MNGNREYLGRLTAMGILPGTENTVLSNVPLAPVMITIPGARLALDSSEEGLFLLHRQHDYL